MTPSWLTLLAPLPETATIERAPVAPPELVAAGQVDAIAGWQSLSVHLSQPEIGLRHVLVTIDAAGRPLSAGDHVMLERDERRGDGIVRVYDHQSLGGRYDDAGVLQGTRWATQTEQRGDVDDAVVVASTPSAPTPAEVEALNAIVADVLRRAPVREP